MINEYFVDENPRLYFKVLNLVINIFISIIKRNSFIETIFKSEFEFHWKNNLLILKWF